MARKSLNGLGSLQGEVMELVWQRGEATVADVVEAIARRRTVSYTTVLVAMQKLRKSGWLKHRARGRAHVYRAARSREQVHGGLLREFLHSAFHGEPKLLVAQLLDEHPMSEAKLAELRQLIDARRKEKRGE